MVGWGQSTGCFHSPAFVDPKSGTTFARPKEKRDLLIRTLLQKAACEEDIPIHIGAQRQPHLPFPPATPHEIQDSLLRTKNSAPGADGIPVVALKRAWPFIQNAVCTLYSWCLEIGWQFRALRDDRFPRRECLLSAPQLPATPHYCKTPIARRFQNASAMVKIRVLRAWWRR